MTVQRPLVRLRQLALAILVVGAIAACAPDDPFDNPCDPTAESFDPCDPSCLECPANATCGPAEGDVGTCGCPHANGWCVADDLCCAAGDVCVEGLCCTPNCTSPYRECGPDGCGGQCGACPGATVCASGLCVAP